MSNRYQGQLTREVLRAMGEAWPIVVGGPMEGGPWNLHENNFKKLLIPKIEGDQARLATLREAGYTTADGKVDSVKLWSDLGVAGFTKDMGSGLVLAGDHQFEFVADNSHLQFDSGGLYDPEATVQEQEKRLEAVRAQYAQQTGPRSI